MKRKTVAAFLLAAFGCIAQAYAQNYAEFIPDLAAHYAIKKADDGNLLTYKGLNGTALFEGASDVFNQAFKFVKVEGDGNAGTDEYYIVSVNVASAPADLEHLNESGVSKIENTPTWGSVRIYRNSDDNTFAIKLAGSDANSSRNKRSTLYINGNRLAFRQNDANYNVTPPESDYVFRIEAVTIDVTPTVTGVSISGSKTLVRGAATQYNATVAGRFLPVTTVSWSLAGANNPSTTISAAGLLTVAANETATKLAVTATSDFDNTQSASLEIVDRAEFIPGLSSFYAIKSAADGRLLTYKGLNGTALFEEASADTLRQAFKFVKAEGDGNEATDEYYIVSINVATEGTAIADLEHLNESGVSKIENNPTWHVVRIFKNADDHTFAIKLAGSAANGSSKRSTLFINGNRLAFRQNDANYNVNPPETDYLFVVETLDIDVTPAVTGVTISGASTLARGTTVQYSAEVAGRFIPATTVTWSLSGASNPATTISGTGLLTVAGNETSSALVIAATSDFDNTRSASFPVSLITPPATPAPTPAHDQANVKSIFSDYYNNNGQFVVNYDDWLAADATRPHKEIITPFADQADNVLFLDTLLNGNVAQISLGAVALADRDSIHIDIYSPGGNDGIGEFDFALYVGTAAWAGASWVQADVWYKITEESRHGQWISIEVPVDKFVEKGSHALVLRLRRGGQGSAGKKLFVDNVYIYTSEYVDHTPTVKSVSVSGSTAVQRATASQYRATVTGANSPSTAVTWSLSGAEDEGTGLSAAGVLTVAAGEPSTTLTVTATSDYDDTKSGSLTVTLVDPVTMTVGTDVDLTATQPHCPAPVPAHDAEHVHALFSNAYDCWPFSIDYSDWATTPTTKEIISPFENNETERVLKIGELLNSNYSQISLGTCNLAGMDSIHIDIYSPGGDQGIGEFDFGLIFAWDGGNHVSANIWLNITEAQVHGRWISFDVALSRFIATNPNFNPANINIIRLRRGGKGSPGKLLYVDNIYAYGENESIQPPPTPLPEDLDAPTTLPAVTANAENVKSIFCEQFEEPDYQETLGVWDVSGDYTLEDDYKTAKMNYGQNAGQDREFVEIIPGNKTIKLTGWNDYPFKIHRNSTTMDLSDMDYLHISAYLASSLVDDKPCSITFFMHDNANAKLDNPAQVAAVAMTPGEWVSVSIPLCYFRDKLDLSNVYVLRPRVGGYASMNVYIDDIFAYKGDPLAGTVVGAPCSDTPPPVEDPIQDSRNGTLPPRETVMLGVNLASASGGTNPGTLGTNYRYPRHEDLYYFNAKGVKLIRLPFRWKRIQGEPDGALTVDDINAMHAVVKEAERLGMWVMPDMHDYLEYARNDTLFEVGVAGGRAWRGSVNAWGPWFSLNYTGITKEHFADAWTKLVDAFSDCSNIWGYDLMNEPKGVNIDVLRDNYQAVIDAIREKDTQAYIVVEGKSYASSSGWPSVSDELKNLTDPANKLIYQAHCYFDKDASGTYQSDYNTEVGNNFDVYKQRLDPFINWCAANGKTGMIGEFGVPYNGATGGDSRYMVLIDSVFSYLKQKHMTATYWCGGAFYETYHITVQPTDNYRVEKSTMAIMEKYIRNFDQPTGTGEIAAGAKISVYPNPVAGTLYIQSETAIQRVRILNLFGQTVYEARPNATQYSIDVSRYAKGNYLLQTISGNGKATTQKLIKQ
ncbi:MAG: cellulase family glycosylhydrolase [Dysgonamonadaceae bacterium]|nr:cellulase family glycosylhydrolase [Dysgonamonadaceae bacterium]